MYPKKSYFLVTFIPAGAFSSFFAEPAAGRPFFRNLRILVEEMHKKGLFPGTDQPELYMGMSADYEVAIEEGATLVRIGTAIFGSRDQKIS